MSFWLEEKPADISFTAYLCNNGSNFVLVDCRVYSFVFQVMRSITTM